MDIVEIYLQIGILVAALNVKKERNETTICCSARTHGNKGTREYAITNAYCYYYCSNYIKLLFMTVLAYA